MNRGHRLLAFAALCVPAAAGAERVVDYMIDETKAAANAAEQGVPLTPLPARGRLHVAVQTAPEVDHEVIRAGIACGAWKIRNPVSLLVRRFAVAWDRDGAPAAALGPGVDLLIKVSRAATVSRCVATGEMKSSCIYRVSIGGETVDRAGTSHPFKVEREAVARGVGICAGMTRGIGLVGRMTAAAMIDAVAATATMPA